MATVINTYSPLSVASEAVGSFYDAKRKKETEDAAAAYTAERDKRTDMESDRTYGLAKNKDTREDTAATDAHALEPGKLTLQTGDITKQGSDLAGEALKQQKQQLDINYQQQHDPLELEYSRLKNKAESGTILTAADTHRLNQLNLQLKQIELQYAAQGKQLEAALKHAQIAHENAETVRALRPPAAPKQSEGERATEAYNAAMGGLSPLGRQFVDMLYGTNNPPNRTQALRALQQARLPDADKQNLQTIIESKETQFVSPTEQAGQRTTAAQRGVTATREAEKAAHAERNQAYEAIAKGQAYGAIPNRLKGLIRSAMVDQGESVENLLATLDNAPKNIYSDTDKALIRGALGTQPNPQTQGGGGWWPFGGH